MTGNPKIYDYLIEFSNETGMVYLNQRDPETDFWEEISQYDSETSPEDFAYGMYETLKRAGWEVDFHNLDYYEDEELDEND